MRISCLFHNIFKNKSTVKLVYFLLLFLEVLMLVTLVLVLQCLVLLCILILQNLFFFMNYNTGHKLNASSLNTLLLLNAFMQ